MSPLWPLSPTPSKSARLTDSATAQRQRADILWYALDDLVSGRLSALAEAETVLKLLQRDKPVHFARAYFDMAQVKTVFRSLTPERQRQLIEQLTAEMERPRP